MPSVPDPKFSFLGLFESHQGNFQVSSISLCKLALGGPNITPLQYFIFFCSEVFFFNRLFILHWVIAY